MFGFGKNYDAWKIDKKNFPKNGNIEEKTKFLLNYASLAPSSHNAQPWKVKINLNKVVFSADYSRLVPVADKENKFLYMGLGCFYKNFEVAADYFGFKITRKNIIRKNILIIEVKLENTGTRTNKELFHAITKRNTNRNSYTDKKISSKDLNKIKQIANKHDISIDIVTNKNKKQQLINLTEKGDYIVWTDPKFQNEHLKWIRHSLTTKADGIPAFTVGIPLLLSFFARTAVKKLPFAKMQSRKNRQLLNSTPYFCFLSHQKHGIEAWERAGEALEEIWLFTTSKGIAVAPLAQIVEVQDLYKETMIIIQTKLRPQIFFRLGYSDKIVKHSPRRSLVEILNNEHLT